MLKQIILAEDNPADVKLAEIAVKELAAEVDLINVSDGQDLLHFLRSNPTDPISFILLDLNMPKINGIDFLKARLEDPELEKIPVIVFSSTNDYKEIYNCYALKANAFVNKPVDLEEYEYTLGSIIQFWCRVPVKLPAKNS